MKKSLFTGSLLALAVSTANAGGFENARLDTAFMYDEGNLVSVGSVRKDFTVKGDTFATDKSVIGDRNATNISAKYQINDDLSVGLTKYDSGAIHINYQDAGGAVSVNTFGPKVDLESDSIALLTRYALSEQVSVMGGVRYDKYKVANADIFGLPLASTNQSAAALRTPPTVSSASDIVPVVSFAFERPEIALRAEIVYQGKSSVSMATTCGLPSLAPPAPGCATDQSTGGLAEFLTLNFQTGIAADTLLFGSIHKGKWSDSQLSVADNEADALSGPTSAFSDSTEYSLGLGRKFTDSLSASISYNWEQAGDKTTTSLFTVNDGYKGVSLGVKYTMDNIELAAGYNKTKLGDVTYSPLGGNALADNEVTAMGAKITVRF